MLRLIILVNFLFSLISAHAMNPAVSIPSDNNSRALQEKKKGFSKPDTTAETVVKHGAVMGKIRQGLSYHKLKPAQTMVTQESGIRGEEYRPEGFFHSTKTQERLYTSLTPPTPNEEEWAFTPLLSDSEAEIIREKLNNAPYTQTEAYVKLMTGKETQKELTYEIIEKFMLTHHKFIKYSTAYSFKNFYSVLASAADQERANRNKFVFYHSANSPIAFLMDVMSMFRSSLAMLTPDQLTVFRGIDFYFDEFKVLTNWMSYIEKNKDKGNIDWFLNYQRVGLAVNPFLLGSSKNEGESTIDFFYGRPNINPPQISHALNDFLEKIGADSTFESKYEILYKKYFKNDENRLFQIFIDPQVVDEGAYSSIMGGNPWSFNIDNKPYFGVEKILTALRQNPESFSKFAENSHAELKEKTKFFKAFNYTIDDYQCRLFLKPEIFHNPKFVQIYSYWKNPAHDREMIAAYQQELQKIVSEDIVKILQKFHRSADHTFAQGIPKLQKLYQFIHERKEEYPHKLGPVKQNIALQRSIEKGDALELNTLLKKNPNVLTMEIIHLKGKGSARDYVNILLEDHKEFSIEFLKIIFENTVVKSKEVLDTLDKEFIKSAIEKNRVDLLDELIIPSGKSYILEALCSTYKYGNLLILNKILELQKNLSETCIPKLKVNNEENIFETGVIEKSAITLPLIYKNTEIILYLLEREYDQNKLKKILLYACQTGQIEVVEYLLNIKKVMSENLLRIAAEYGQTAMVSFLLNIGFPIDAASKEGMLSVSYTPLTLAVLNNKLDTIKLLIKRGADINFIIKDETALETLIKENLLEATQLLIDRSFEINDMNTNINIIKKAYKISRLAGSDKMKELLKSNFEDVNKRYIVQ